MNTMTTEALDTFATNMASVVRTLMAWRGIKAVQARESLHISKGTWHNRMHDGSWTAWELLALAELLQVDVADLYQDPDDLFRKRSILTAEMALIKGSGGISDPGPSRPVRHLAPVR